MELDPGYVIPVLITVAAFMAVSFLLVKLFIRKKIGHRRAEQEIRLNSEWTIALIAEPKKKYNLCLEFQIEHPGGEDHFGIMADYSCCANNEPLVVEKACIGNLISSDNCRKIMSSYNVSLTSIGGFSKYRATVVLCSGGPFSNGVEVKATGKITALPGIELKRGVLFFSC